MQDQSISSEEKLKEAKERLQKSMLRLEQLINKQQTAVKTERNLRTQIIKDLDSHIANLETILKE